MGASGDIAARRLSKPRTNTSTSNLLSYSDQSNKSPSTLTSSDMDYFGEDATILSSQGERRSRRKSRGKIRAYLYGSNSENSQTLSSDEESEGTNGLAGAARDARKRISRTGSSLMLLTNAKASTSHLSNSSTPRLLLASDPEESAMIAEQIKERAHLDSLAAKNHVTPPVDEDKHVDSVMAPLRRKSLYTPGIATRHPNDILRKPPPPESIQSQADRDYYYNPAYPDSSPLSRLASLSLKDGRSTPQILNYTQLGGLQLGTLRVTNGTASPIPQNHDQDALIRSFSPESQTQDDYITASEGGRSEDEAGNRSKPADTTMTDRVPISDPTRSEISLMSETEEVTISKAEQEAYPEFLGPAPSKKPSHCRASSMASEYISEIAGSPYSETPYATIGDRLFEDEGIAIPQSQQPEIEVWRSFINEAEARHATSGTTDEALQKLNGNAPCVPESPRLSIPSSTSRYIASMNPGLPNDSGYSSNVSLDASHVARGNSIEVASNEPMPDRSPRKSRCLSGPREMPSPILKEGYFPRMVSPALRCPSFTVTPRRVLPNPEPTVSSARSLEPTTNARSTSQHSSQTFVRKLQKPRPKSQPPPVNTITIQAYHDLTQAHIPRVPSVVATKHAERLNQFPPLEHTFPSSQQVSANRMRSPTSIHAVPFRFPSPANALEAAAANFSSAPIQTETKRRSRSLFRSQSKNRNSTVADEDAWGTSSIVRSPSWSDYGGGRKKKEQSRLAREEKETEKRLLREERELAKRLEKDRRDLEKQMKKNEIKHKSSYSRASSRTRGRSSERRMSHHEIVAAIASFGTVTESLGRSPYDVATSMFPNASQNARKNVGKWHPHQIGTAMPRAKSMIGMDNPTAQESTCARSRIRSQSFGGPPVQADEMFDNPSRASDRKVRTHSVFIDTPPMPALSAVDIKTHDLEWARSCQRSRSLSKLEEPKSGPEPEPFNDRGGIPGKSIRPRSMIVDAPPVPALPSLQQIKQRETKVTRSRPHSIASEAPAAPASPKLQNEGLHETPRLNDSRLTTLSPPRKSKAASKAIPGIWSNGSLEKKSPIALELERLNTSGEDSAASDDADPSDEDNIWEAQKRMWAERRRSAGQALLLRNQLTEIFAGAPISDINIMQSQSNRPHSLTESYPTDPQDLATPKQMNTPVPNPLALNPYIAPTPAEQYVPYESLHQLPQLTRPGPSPLIAPPIPLPPNAPAEFHLPSPSQRRSEMQTPTRHIPCKRVGSGTSTPSGAASHFEYLTGRYEGGLLYGYEPGCGLGGSAGTRSAKTEASRKSVGASRGFGLDLSDVPVFVAASLK